MEEAVTWGYSLMTPVYLFDMEAVDGYAGKRSTTQATSIVSETERLLSKLGHGYKKAKAQQIFRLLKDQEALNQRFKDCALDDDDGGDEIDNDADSDGQGSLDGNVGDAPACAHERRKKHSPRKSKNASAAVGAAPKKIASNVDPSRCRTSMGFYNEAEFSGSVGDVDEENDLSDFEAETDAAIIEEHEAIFGRHGLGSDCQSRRLFRLQMSNGNADAIPEEGAIQSARSSRPKTGIAQSSARSKQYRRPCQNNQSMKKMNHRSTVTTSVSKLEGPVTPRGGIRGFCDNSYDSMLQLTPRFNDRTVGFMSRLDDMGSISYSPRNYDTSITTPRRQANDIPAYLTPRPSDNKNCIKHRSTNETPRQSDLAITPRGPNQHRALINFYNGQLTSRDEFQQYVTSPRLDDQSGIVTPRGFHHHTKPGRVIDKSLYETSTANKFGSTSNGTSMCMPHTPRSTLTVDQSPIHVIPTGCLDANEVVTPRRQKNDTKTKKRADIQRTGAHNNLSKISERVHPINVMKLPPLEISINKPVIF